jgi:RecA-family ATPase
VSQKAIADGLDREAQRLDKQRHQASSKANGNATELISIRASNIVPEKVEWLWPGRLARGKHTCIAGEQGTGKSQLSIAIIAAITTGGSWPCGEGQSPIKGNVVILSAEDGAADTIVPRLEAAGADLSRVVIVSAVRLDGNGRRTFNLQTDIDKLERKISEIGDVALVVIDPVSSYLGKTDSHKNSEVRGVLEPLAEMADRTRVAVLSITHFNKPGSANTVKALHRIIGSVAFSAAPRVAFAVIEDAENPGRYLVLHAKNNLAPAPQGLAYRLEQTIITNGIVASRIGWETEPVAMTANQAMAADAAGGEHQIDEAVKLLRDLLAEGPVTAKQVKDEADGACISWRTIKRAKGKLGIISEKPDMASGWVWTLLEGGQQCRRVPTLKGGPLREIWPPSETARPLKVPSGQGVKL